jgi:hypothetical protein
VLRVFGEGADPGRKRERRGMRVYNTRERERAKKREGKVGSVRRKARAEMRR